MDQNLPVPDVEPSDPKTAYRTASRRAGWKVIWWGLATIVLYLGIPLVIWTIGGALVLTGLAIVANIVAVIMAAKWIAIVATGHPTAIAPAFCPYCGFDLHGLRHELCPECGGRLPAGAQPEASPEGGDHAA